MFKYKGVVVEQLKNFGVGLCCIAVFIAFIAMVQHAPIIIFGILVLFFAWYLGYLFRGGNR